MAKKSDKKNVSPATKIAKDPAYPTPEEERKTLAAIPAEDPDPTSPIDPRGESSNPTAPRREPRFQIPTPMEDDSKKESKKK